MSRSDIARTAQCLTRSPVDPPTSFCPAMKPRAASAAERWRWLLLTKRKAATGSPRIDGSTWSFKTSKIPGRVSVAGF